MSILQTLRIALPNLPKKLALAARYALEQPDQVALNSMRGAAAEVGVTSTTMLRLARHLGYENYNEFRASFQSELINGVFGARAGALHHQQHLQVDDAHSEAKTLGDEILQAAQSNVGRMRSNLRQEDLDAISQRIRAAPNVYLVGSGSLHWIASMMKNTGNMVLPNLRLVGAEYSTAAEAMGALGDDDVVIGFGMNPTARRTLEALAYARKSGAHIVAITDRPSSPLAEGAEFVLFGDNSSPHYYPSVAPMMVIVEALLANIVASGDGQELRRIQSFEATRRSSGRYMEY